MNSKYKTVKYKKNKPSNIEDLVSIEEPLEMVVRYKKDNEWVDNSISITMRTPKNDEDLIVGLLFCEGIIQKISEVEKVEFLGVRIVIEIELSTHSFSFLYRTTISSGSSIETKSSIFEGLFFLYLTVLYFEFILFLKVFFEPF